MPAKPIQSLSNLRGRLTVYWPRLWEVTWVLALLGLPITSFTVLAEMSGALIAPISALPVGILLVFYCLPMILRGGSLPKESLVLVIFIIAAVVSSAGAFFIEMPSLKGRTVAGQELRALLTLAIGIAFYFVFASYPNSIERLRKSWQWINLGGAVALGWSLLQAYFILSEAAYFPGWVEAVQDFMVIPSPQLTLWNKRVNAFTYEASWFAHQLVMLYIPLWLAAAFQGTSAYKFRIWRISIENLLLVVGIFCFFQASPRVGLISFLLMIGYLFLLVNVRLVRQITRFITNLPAVQGSKASRALRIATASTTSLLMLGFYLGLLAAMIYISSQRDWRLSLLFETSFTQDEFLSALMLKEYPWLMISQRLAFLERMLFWVTGLHIFQHFPLLGVGLGNAGFFFPEHLPGLGWVSIEVRALLYRIQAFPNTKSLWVRLLAETGVIGFALFATWLYLLFRSALLSYRSRVPLIRTFALAGQLFLVALIGEGFSIDSFAMPYLWISAGMLSATGFIYRREAVERSVTQPAGMEDVARQAE